jgi:hypothetical protein
MARDFNAFVPGKKEGTILTPKCRLIYPQLFEAVDMKGNPKGPEEKLRYRLTILVPKKADLTLLRERVEAVIQDEAPAKDRSTARKPWLKTADSKALEKYSDEFPVMLRVHSKYAPQVVGPDPTRALTEDEVYSGRWGVVSLNPYWYGSIDGGKPGVALGMGNVQFLDHADKIGGSRVTAEDEFEPADDVEDSAPPSARGNSTSDDLFG